jgi:hypothetical protein
VRGAGRPGPPPPRRRLHRSSRDPGPGGLRCRGTSSAPRLSQADAPGCPRIDASHWGRLQGRPGYQHLQVFGQRGGTSVASPTAARRAGSSTMASSLIRPWHLGQLRVPRPGLDHDVRIPFQDLRDVVQVCGVVRDVEGDECRARMSGEHRVAGGQQRLLGGELPAPGRGLARGRRRARLGRDRSPGEQRGGRVLERLVRRMEWHLRGLLQTFEDETEPDGEGDPEGNLAASAGSGQTPPAGPRWVSRLCAPRAACAGLRQATVGVARWVHLARGDAGGRSPPGRPGGVAPLRATSSGRAGAGGAAPRRAGAHRAKECLRRRDDRGRHGPAVAAVSAGHRRAPPRRHTIKYAGVLAPASPWRWHLAPMASSETPADGQRPRRPARTPSYRPWAELLARTFAVDVLGCRKCQWYSEVPVSARN